MFPFRPRCLVATKQKAALTYGTRLATQRDPVYLSVYLVLGATGTAHCDSLLPAPPLGGQFSLPTSAHGQTSDHVLLTTYALPYWLAAVRLRTICRRLIIKDDAQAASKYIADYVIGAWPAHSLAGGCISANACPQTASRLSSPRQQRLSYWACLRGAVPF